MFRIYRFFATASGLVVVAAMVVVGFFYHHNAVQDLVQVAEDNNVAIARTLSNIVLSRYENYVQLVSGLDGDALRARPETSELNELLAPLTEGLSVLKVKVYNPEGLTIYSSEARQIGESKSEGGAFEDAAKHGATSSQLSYRDRFSAFSGEVFQRDVVETYVPVRDASAQIIGVFEIYSDVTRVKQRIDHGVISMVVVLAVVCALLYAVLVLVVMRAAIAPLHRISERAKAITAQTPGLRLPTEGMPSELRPLILAMNAALDRLDHALDAQRQFSGDAAHELLTPLAVLTAHLDTLPDQETARSIRQDVDRMTEVVTQLLELAEFDALDPTTGEETDLREVCTEVAAMLAPMAIRQDREIALVGDDEPVKVRCCARALSRAVRNLIENAIRHTPPGTEVEIEIGRDGTIAVSDHGAGVPEEQRELIFRRFWRGDDKDRRGSGLGLSIVKRFAEAYGGGVRVDDSPGGGARFTLWLPRPETPA